MREDFRVARIGRLAAEHGRCAFRAAEDFVHQREFHLSVALAAEFGAEVTGPQATFFYLRLQWRDQFRAVRVRKIVRMPDHEIERFDFFRDECVDPIEFALELRVCFE